MRIITPPKSTADERQAQCLFCKCEFAYRREDTQGTIVSKDFDGIAEDVKRFSVCCPGCKHPVDITGFQLYDVDTQYPF